MDTQAPQISGSLSGTPGSNGWYISNAILSATATDSGSDIAAFTYILDDGTETAYINALILTDGQHTIVLNAKDRAGLTDSSTQNIQVDTIAPALTVSTVLPEWVQDTVTLNGTAADPSAGSGQAGSGLLKVEVSTDNGATWHATTGTSAWNYAWNTQSGINGAYTVRVRSTDYAGLTTQNPFIAQVDNTAPHVELPAEWNIWDTVTFDAWDHDSGLSGAEIVISDPQDRWPKRRLTFAPGQLPVGLKWDRRFGDGTIAPLGDYEVDARAGDNLGNSRHVTATIHINLVGSLFPAPVAATPLPPAQPTATRTPTSLIPTLTNTAQSTNSQSTLFGTPGSGVGAIASPLGTPTATSVPVVRPTPTQTDIITIIQSFFSPPPDTTETVSDFESDITPFGGPGPSMFAAAQAAQTDPGQMAGNVVFGGAAAAAIATFAAYIEQKKREEAAAAAAAAEASARRRRTARSRHMSDGERQAENLHEAIAAVTAKEQKEWKAERYEQISQTDEYKNSDNKTQFMKQGLENIKEQEAAYRAEQKRKAEDEAEAARKAAEEAALAAKLPPMPEGLSPEAQMAFLHGGANWIASNAGTLQAQYAEDLANRQQAAEVNTPGKGVNGLASLALDNNEGEPSWLFNIPFIGPELDTKWQELTSAYHALENRANQNGYHPILEFLGEGYLIYANDVWQSKLVQTPLQNRDITLGYKGNFLDRINAGLEITRDTALPIVGYGLAAGAPAFGASEIPGSNDTSRTVKAWSDLENYGKWGPNRIIDEIPGPMVPNSKLVTLSGSNLDDLPLGTAGDKSTVLLWTADERGINLIPEQTLWPTSRFSKIDPDITILSHTNISKGAFAGGEAWRTGVNELTMSPASGAYGYNPYTLSPSELLESTARFDAAIDFIRELGIDVNIFSLK